MILLSRGRFDPERRVVVGPAGPVRLSPLETRVLVALARVPGESWPAERLLREVWGYRPGLRSRAVVVTIQRLRSKIEADPARPVELVTADGGYALRPAGGPLAELVAAGARRVRICGGTPEARRALAERARALPELEVACASLPTGRRGEHRLALPPPDPPDASDLHPAEEEALATLRAGGSPAGLDPEVALALADRGLLVLRGA